MGFSVTCAIGGFKMEKPPYIFQDITHFLVRDEEKRDLRIDYIAKITLEIGSSIPPGRFSLDLIKPFPPFGREGTQLSTLRSLRAEDIESIQAFRKTVNGKKARLEIGRKASNTNIIVKCERIEGVPSRN